MVKTVCSNYLKNRVHKQAKKRRDMRLYNIEGEGALTLFRRVKFEAQNHPKQAKKSQKSGGESKMLKLCR